MEGQKSVKVDIFNEFPILNSIYKSRTPIISAIGHASSNPLSNIVADLSEDTPSSTARYVGYKYENYKKKKRNLIIFGVFITICVIVIKKYIL